MARLASRAAQSTLCPQSATWKKETVVHSLALDLRGTLVQARLLPQPLPAASSHRRRS